MHSNVHKNKCVHKYTMSSLIFWCFLRVWRMNYITYSCINKYLNKTYSCIDTTALQKLTTVIDDDHHNKFIIYNVSILLDNNEVGTTGKEKIYRRWFVVRYVLNVFKVFYLQKEVEMGMKRLWWRNKTAGEINWNIVLYKLCELL